MNLSTIKKQNTPHRHARPHTSTDRQKRERIVRWRIRPSKLSPKFIKSYQKRFTRWRLSVSNWNAFISSQTSSTNKSNNLNYTAVAT